MNRAKAFRRVFIAAPVLLLALSASTGTATAHEDHEEGGGGPPEPFSVTCEGIDYTITTGNGNWAAAIDRQAGAVFLPKAFTFTLSVGGEVVENESLAQGNGNAHKNQQTITCVFADSFTDEEGVTVEFAGTATVVRAR